MIGDAPVKIAVEAAVRQGWDAIIGADGLFVGMNSFGASAPYKELYKHFGITAGRGGRRGLAQARQNLICINTCRTAFRS